MKNPNKLFMPNRQIFMAGENQPETQKQPEKPVDAPSLETNVDKTRQEGKKTVDKAKDILNQFQAEQLKNGPETEYKAQPFTKEELSQKTKNYPEVRPAAPADIIKSMKDSFKAQNNENMDHGDTASAFIDYGDGKGEKEVILLCDKSSGHTQYRVFKQS